MPNIDTASRLSCASGCPKKFRYQYVEKIPQRDGGAFILGNTVHNGLQAWFQLRKEHGDQPKGTLWKLMQEAWEQELPAQLWRHVKPDLENTLALERIAGALKLQRGLVRPESSKDYQATPEYAKRGQLADKVQRWLDSNESVIRWNKSEPPTKTWMVARKIAKTLEEIWAPRPLPALVEQPFIVEHEGYTWRGRLDVYGPMTHEGELLPHLIDWKTGAQPPSPMELFIQATVYHMAMSLQDLPVDEVQFHILRLPYTDHGKNANPVRIVIDPEKHYPMLTSMRKMLEFNLNYQGIYTPSYSFSCRSCDYAKMCAAELGIIKEDSPDGDFGHDG